MHLAHGASGVDLAGEGDDDAGAGMRRDDHRIGQIARPSASLEDAGRIAAVRTTGLVASMTRARK